MAAVWYGGVFLDQPLWLDLTHVCLPATAAKHLRYRVPRIAYKENAAARNSIDSSRSNTFHVRKLSTLSVKCKIFFELPCYLAIYPRLAADDLLNVTKLYSRRIGICLKCRGQETCGPESSVKLNSSTLKTTICPPSDNG